VRGSLQHGVALDVLIALTGLKGFPGFVSALGCFFPALIVSGGGRGAARAFRWLNLDPDEPHQFDAVAFGDNAIVQLEIEGHSAVPNVVLEMDVVEAVVLLSADVGEREVVRADEANCAAREQGTHDAFCTGEAVFRVCPLEELVEQEEDRGLLFGEVADVAQAGDLGVEAGVAFLERVVDENACAYL